MMGKLNKRLTTLGMLSLGLFFLQGLANEKGGMRIAQAGVSQDIIAYGQMCAQAIREIPPFKCLDGVVIPITVNGKTPSSYSPNMACDRPSLLPLGKEADGQCVPNSRVLNLSQGDAQFAVLCRQKKIRPADSIFFDEVDIVAHNVKDGSTCWFQASAKDEKGLDTTRVPPPNEEDPPPGQISARDFWNNPAQVAQVPLKDRCGYCHDNDPFMYSPFIGQVWEHVPTDPFGWYKHIGVDFQGWKKPVSLSTRNNACVGCHRLGVEFTSGQATKEAVGLVPIKNANDWAEMYPASHFMPPGNFYSARQWNTIYSEAVKEILACYQKPTADGCLTVPITGKPQ